MKHATDVRVGYELIQTTSTDTDDNSDEYYYWQIRIYPYTFAAFELAPYMTFGDIFDPTQQAFSLETTAVFDSFDIGAFGEIVLWWNYP